jgi:hypothetical protein
MYILHPVVDALASFHVGTGKCPHLNLTMNGKCEGCWEAIYEFVGVLGSSAEIFHPLCCCCVKIFFLGAAFVLFACIAVFASHQENRAADSVAAAFMQAREAAHLPKLKRMGGNTFREKVCKNDLRFASGLILTAQYQTSTPDVCPKQLNGS